MRMDQAAEALGHAVSPRMLLPLALAGIAGVDAMRVVAHEHWVSDVVAGDVVGAVAVAVGEAIVGNIAGMRG
jgi:hypothetical protein